MPLQILVVEDQRAFRQLLVEHIREKTSYKVCAEAGNGQEALQKQKEHFPQVMLLDLGMPVMDGYAVLEELKHSSHRPLVMVLSERSDAGQIIRAIHAGADGYFCKDNDPQKLTTAIVQLLETGHYFDENAQYALYTYSNNANALMHTTLGQPAEFSPTEKELFFLLALGMPNNLIGQRLNFSVSKVEKIKSDLFKRTSTHNNAQLITYGFCNRLINPEKIAEETLKTTAN
jgi:DNA-binding NarL/FixJ family response regulator